MKKEPKYIIRNLGTGHFYCEGKYNFCTNQKYAREFTLAEANLKAKELREFFNCEIIAVETITRSSAEGKEVSNANNINV